MQSIAIITKSKFLKRDYSRYGISNLKKNFYVDIIDVSNITLSRSNEYYTFEKLNTNIQLKNFFDLFNLLRKKKYEFVIDYTENSLPEVFIRFLIKFNGAKIIKYLGGIKPKIYYDDLNYSKIIVITKSIISWLKYNFLKYLNRIFIDVVIVTGKDYYYQKSLVDGAKNIIFSHNYYYNTYLKLKKKKTNPKKLYIVY